MTGELSEDGKWIWDGSEWKPYRSTPDSREDSDSPEWSNHNFSIQVIKKPFRVKLFIFFALSILILITVQSITNNTFQEWCESEWNNLDGDGGSDSYRKVTVEDDGAPYDGGCFVNFLGGFDQSETWFNDIITMVLIPLGFIVSIPLLSWGIGLEKGYHCGACGEQIKKQVLMSETQFDVKSTSASTKEITTTSPQLGIGRIGGKSGSFVSLSSSTSHVPTVLGRILSSHECQNTLCSAINQWQFDAEVQVWTDAATNEVSYDITGQIQLPK